jgi:hypothetical protein
LSSSSTTFFSFVQRYWLARWSRMKALLDICVP